MFNWLRKGKDKNELDMSKDLILKNLNDIKKLNEEQINLIGEWFKIFRYLSTKKDIERVFNEIKNSEENIVKEINTMPKLDDISNLFADNITKPIKLFVAKRLSDNQAVKQENVKQLSSNQAAEQSLDGIVNEMKNKLSMLSQRHIKILNILAQNRDIWMDYETIGMQCSPSLSSSCVRGYISDLVNNYKIPVEKETYGRQTKVRLPDHVFKRIAITKLSN